jgi:hypothetical protein
VTTLPAILGALTAILQSHPLCERTEIVETREFSPDQFYFKVRSELPHGFKFQARVYSNASRVDYAYQLFKEDQPLLRWDNKEEFRSLKTYPHHHHDERGNILPSSLTGNPQADIALVFREIEKFLADLI